jgi:hypothetical protein
MTDDLGPARTFFQFMDVVMASDLTSTQKWLLIAQARHADTHGGELTNSYPSEGTLARKTGLSKDTIQRARKTLVEKGWLVQTHSGRGGSSKLANSFDLAVPDEALAKPQGAVLQSRTMRSQSRTVPDPKPHCAATSVPSSAHITTHVSTPPNERRLNQPDQGTKEGRGDSYWVGYSKKHPEGYFIRAKGSSEPKGNHVLVTLTGTQVMNLFGVGYEYEQRRDIMLDYARDAGLRPPARDGKVPATRTSPGARYPELGPSPFTVIRREPESRSRSQQEIARDILEGRWRAS